MTDIVKPTGEELRSAWMEDNPDYQAVHQKADPSWRHGCYMTTIFKRQSDDTYWAANYQVTGDGDYNTLRDDPDDVHIHQVWPMTRTIVDYTRIKPE